MLGLEDRFETLEKEKMKNNVVISGLKIDTNIGELKVK